ALRWAWCSINTRSVFMDRPSSSFLSGPDNYALAPFLDLLNHRPDVQVKAGFNRTTGCYEVRSISGVQRYHQAFINYGCHDNQRLLLEYGFVSSCNPHSVIYVEEDVVRSPCHHCPPPPSRRNLTLSDEGPSWRLLTALRLLSPQRWRTLLLGQMVSDEEEQRSVQTAKTLCEHLFQSHSHLERFVQISHLLQQSERPVREQLQVVGSLRREERCILGNCLEVLKSALEI
uniref:Rubisco LSMT substrate-binding domain-containing protein n=1 Tax=Oryzias sinensis TaxID=183150 RepID=A0A8C7XNV9_9TELE